jgi:hypothetical protein
VNQALKLVFKIPRPWKTPGFTAVESAIPEASGYSFPSGHTQNAAGTFGGIARWSKRTPVRIISLSVIVLVAFSRMYLGVHTPLDVCFSLVFGGILVFALYPIFSTEERFERCMPFVVCASVLLSFAHILFVFLMPEAEVDPENLASGMKNAATLFGCTLGLIPVYILDRRLIKFDTGAKWYAQILKLVLGLLGVLLIKEGLESPLEALLRNEYTARTVRYFLVVMFAGAVWPLTFSFFSGLRIKAIDKLTDKK